MSKKENKISIFVERIMSKKDTLTVRYKDVSFSPKVMQAVEELRKGKEVNYKSLTSLERNEVGLCYWYGHILPLNYQEAVKWYLAAEEKKGCSRAEFNLYVCYRRGTGVETNMDEAISWLKKAARHNDVSAQFILAEYYFDGRHVRKNKRQAKYWFDRCIANPELNEESIVMNNLGVKYYEGKYGFEQNIEKATEYFEKAAEKGCSLSVLWLVEIYYGHDRKKRTQWMQDNKEFVIRTLSFS